MCQQIIVADVRIAKPIPMKRELKLSCDQYDLTWSSEDIAKPIPMKRELKPLSDINILTVDADCKAHPDEKGIETITAAIDPEALQLYCKAHPDEKGIETADGGCGILAYRAAIAKPIPMKRELKLSDRGTW